MKYAQLAKEHLEKARDAALLAVEFYNKPAVRFRSGGYITMMCIAWTALFHAIFFKRRIKPFYRLQDNHTFDRREGDFRYWELKTCLQEYFKERTTPVRSNVQFFIPLRNRIEHRSMPTIDSSIFGECQSLLFNFDQLIQIEFGAKCSLNECLSLSLQIFPRSADKSTLDLPRDVKNVLKFIRDYRSSLESSVFADSRYAFKAFLIKVGSHDSRDALPIQFIDYDTLDSQGQAEVSKIAALVKDKHVNVLGHDLHKPGEVVKLVQLGIGNLQVKKLNGFNPAKFTLSPRFNQRVHTLCWKKFEVRPPDGSPAPAKTIQKYCVYDKLNRNYGYTAAWVDFLIEKISNDQEYLALLKHPHTIELVPVSKSAIDNIAPSRAA
ncbi:MAG TPA: DUF3644 domain-containing protein [Terrimicrobiaceae bacterium]